MDFMGVGKDYRKKIENRKSEGGKNEGILAMAEKRNIKKLHTQPHESYLSKENKEVLVWKLKFESGRN